MIKNYLLLTKPRIIFGNVITLLGGFFLASQGNIDCLLLTTTILSISLIIASGCVCNNIIDCDLDKKMVRTKNRILPKNLISTKSSFVYACILSILGFILLSTINILIVCLVAWGFFVYVFWYSIYLKRNSIYSTLLGSLAGAIPPTAGYCAVTSNFDSAALVLMIIFSIWQIPHSYAIAIMNYEDYKLANIPVLSVVKGIEQTINHITLYIILFMLSLLLLTILGYVGNYYLIVTLIMSFLWFKIAVTSFRYTNKIIWANKIFIFSIIIITTVSIMIAIDYNQCN